MKSSPPRIIYQHEEDENEAEEDQSKESKDKEKVRESSPEGTIVVQNKIQNKEGTFEEEVVVDHQESCRYCTVKRLVCRGVLEMRCEGCAISH